MFNVKCRARIDEQQGDLTSQKSGTYTKLAQRSVERTLI